MRIRTFLLSMAFWGAIAGRTYCQPTSPALDADSTFTNPLLSSGADPWTIFHEGNYYYVKSEAGAIVLMRTPDITDLAHAYRQTVWTAPPDTDHSRNVWAPEIHHVRGAWYIYVAADDGDNRHHRMFVLENTSPDPFTGSFDMKARIKTDPDDNWAIDGSVFAHRDTLYFIWSGWETPKEEGGEERQRIYLARMSNPWTIESERVELSQPDQEWERHWDYPDAWTPDAPVYVNEGPQLLSHGNKLHIIYSASGCWTPYYALGRLTADRNSNLMDPTSWTKAPQPVFQQSAKSGVYGTGHPCFFKSPDGTEDWMLYHANDDPADGCSNRRSPRAQRIHWTEDDLPLFGKPLPTSEPIVKPSGTLRE